MNYKREIIEVSVFLLLLSAGTPTEYRKYDRVFAEVFWITVYLLSFCYIIVRIQNSYLCYLVHSTLLGSRCVSIIKYFQSSCIHRFTQPCHSKFNDSAFYDTQFEFELYKTVYVTISSSLMRMLSGHIWRKSSLGE